MSGATEETHENVVTARFLRGTVWPCRLVITAVNVEGKRRGQPRFEPFPFRRHRLTAAFVLCVCVCVCLCVRASRWRHEVMSLLWGLAKVAWLRCRPQLVRPAATAVWKKAVTGFNKPAAVCTVPSASTFRRFVFCPKSVFRCFVQFSQITGTKHLIDWPL